MDYERSATLRALADAATPAPWFYDKDGEHVYVRDLDSEEDIADDPGTAILEDFLPNSNGPRNMAFIVAARTAVPELLNEVARCRRLCFEIEELMRDSCDPQEILNNLRAKMKTNRQTYYDRATQSESAGGAAPQENDPAGGSHTS